VLAGSTAAALSPPAVVHNVTVDSTSIGCLCAAPPHRLVTCGLGEDVALVRSSLTGVVEATLVGHTAKLLALCPLTDGSEWLLSGDGAGAIVAHDLGVAHGGASLSPIREYAGHTDAVLSIVELSGGRFASASECGIVRMWAIESDACLATLRGHTGTFTNALAAADEDTLVSGGEDGVLQLWDTPPPPSSRRRHPYARCCD